MPRQPIPVPPKVKAELLRLRHRLEESERKAALDRAAFHARIVKAHSDGDGSMAALAEVTGYHKPWIGVLVQRGTAPAAPRGLKLADKLLSDPKTKRETEQALRRIARG